MDDVARGTVAALKEVGYEIFNIGGGKAPISLNQIISLIETLLGKKANVVRKEFHRADIVETRADVTKAKEVLNWEPTVSVEEGVRRTVEWYQENVSWLREIPLP